MAGPYYVKRTEAQLWTVGLDAGDGFEPHSDHGDPDEASEYAAWLNGGPEPKAVRIKNQREQRRYEISRDVLAALLVDGNTVFHNYAENRACKTPEESLLWGSRAAVEWADALLKALER